MKRNHLPNLSLCLLLDFIGMSSYIFPFVGELFDFIWAPISGILFFFLFGKKMGVFGGIFSFLEELSPGLDIIPTFTLAWIIRKRELSKTMQGLKKIE
ncbi:MAG: hypothetical protein ABIP35_01605 [Ginsengibacter sp.]